VVERANKTFLAGETKLLRRSQLYENREKKHFMEEIHEFRVSRARYLNY